MSGSGLGRRTHTVHVAARRMGAAATVLLAVTACTERTEPRQARQMPEPQQAEQQSSPPAAGMFSLPQPWTTDVSAVVPAPRSDAILRTLADAGGWGADNGLQIDFSLPVITAEAAAPQVPVVGVDDYCYGGPDCDDVPATMPIPANAHLEGSNDLACDTTGGTDGQEDCHLLVVAPAERRLYEVYQATMAGASLTAQGYFVWDLDRRYPETLRGDQCTSADAAGFPIAALTPTADEVASGSVDHALRFVLPNDRIKEGVYVRPATHAGGPTSTDPDAPPYGVRLRLRADVDESGYTDSEKVLLTALKTYGMLLSDGGQIPLTFADDRDSAATWSQLGIDADSLRDITVDQFEVVDLGEEIPLTYDCVRNP